MRTRGLAALLLGLCATTGRAEAQLARVERRGAAEVAATPGEPLAIPFRVTNAGAAPAAIPGTAELPAGWRLAAGAAPRPLEPGEAELRLLGVGVPASAPAGRHVVRYRAGDAADSAVVVVAARRGIQVEPPSAGGMTVAGAAYTVRFRVVNRGNVAERVALRAEGDQGMRPEPDSAALTLAPAGEAVVTVRARTPGDAPASLRHQVTLHVQADGASGSARTIVSVVPRGGARVRRPRLPAEIRVRADDSLSAASFAVSAQGPLDRAGRVHLQAEARTADPAGTPFARQDEYRLRLSAPDWELRLGDGVHALSRLTEPGLYGFGAGGSLRRGWIEAGGMVVRDRRGQGRGGVTGGFVRLGGERAGLGFAYAAPDSAPARWSVQAHAAPHPLLRLEAEAAPAAADSVLPRALHLHGGSPLLSYDLLHLRGGAARGQGGTADQDQASLTLRPFGQLSLSASARRGGDGYLPGDSVPPRDHRRAAAAWGSRVSVEARESTSGTPSRGDYRSVYARLGFRLLRRAWLYPAFEGGEVVPAAGAAPAPFRIFSLQSSFFAGGASLWAQVQVREGASAWEPGERAVSGSVAAHLPVLPSTLLRVSGQGRRIGGGALEGSLDVALERTLPADHRVSVRALAVAQQAGGWRPRMYLEYALPLGVPLPARAGEGVVARIVDARTGRGMPDVMVRLGDRFAITDRRGVAAFAGMPAGTHLLRVEAAAGTELVADREMPIPVAVDSQGAARTEVRLQPAARLAGRVERAAPGDAAGSPAVPMAGVRVQVTGPGGAHHVVTDADGRFTIGGMRPGWWRVRVDPASLPRHHQGEADQHLLLVAGQTGEVWPRVVEKERPVQMIQGGELTLPE